MDGAAVVDHASARDLDDAKAQRLVRLLGVGVAPRDDQRVLQIAPPKTLASLEWGSLRAK
jgi:hypothetical protein